MANDSRLARNPGGGRDTASGDAPTAVWRGESVVSVVREFVSLSRSTALLLAAFILVLGVYLWVRDEPLVARRPAPPPVPTRSSDAPSPSSTSLTASTSALGSAPQR